MPSSVRTLLQAFYADISQDIMESMMDEMATPRPVDGVNTSLKDLGYLCMSRPFVHSLLLHVALVLHPAHRRTVLSLWSLA